jgi:type I restriction enzyme S subunit
LNTAWEPTPLGDLLKRSEKIVTINPLETYKQVTVRLWGRGVILRDEVSGSEISAAKRYEVKPRQFILSKIDARNGAFGLVPPDLDGAVVSGDFPVFDINSDRLEPKYLEWKSKTEEFVDLCRAASEGTTNRVRLKEGKFLRLSISLPPLPEQRRIVAKIEALAARIDEARRLRKQVRDQELLQLRNSAFRLVFQGKVNKHDSNDTPVSELIDKMKTLKAQLIEEKKIKKEIPFPAINETEKLYHIPDNWEWVRLRDICELITDGSHLTPHYVDNGMMFISAQNVKPYKFMPENHKYILYEEYLSFISHAKPEKGDILMTRVGAMIGEAAIIDQDLDFAIYVSLCLIRPFKECIHIPFLLHWLNSPYGAASSKRNTLGRGHSQGNLNLNLINRFIIPLPPLNEQQRIANYLDQFQQKVDSLRQLQEQTAAELDALLPAILDRAFRGEL